MGGGGWCGRFEAANLMMTALASSSSTSQGMIAFHMAFHVELIPPNYYDESGECFCLDRGGGRRRGGMSTSHAL
jgi:hypothetical protein